MSSLDRIVVAIIGAGSAGITFAHLLKHDRNLKASIEMFESSEGNGSIPAKYPKVNPNSPWFEFISPLLEARESLPTGIENLYDEIVKSAQESPSLYALHRAERLIRAFLHDGGFFGIGTGVQVDNIVEKRRTENGKLPLYEIKTNCFLFQYAHTVLCAQGARPKELPQPLSSIFTPSQYIGLEDALDSDFRYDGNNVVIVGAAHSAALALRNALNNGAERVELWHRQGLTENPFRPYYDSLEGSVVVKVNRFTGVREPHYSRLIGALSAHQGIHRFVNFATDGKNVVLDNLTLDLEHLAEQYKNWYVVNATGFEQNPLWFTDINGNRGLLQHAYQDKIGETPPFIVYPGAGIHDREKIIPFVFGLGIAYPQIYENGCLDTPTERTIERPGARIIGTNLTLVNAKAIINYLRDELRGRLE